MSKKSSKGAASSKHSDPFDRMPNESAKAYSRSKANQAKHAGLVVRRINLADAAPHPDNPRNHPAKGTPEWEALRQSLLSDYFDPMVLNSRNGLLVSGQPRLVFSSSMCDIFEDHPTIEAERAKLWALIRATPNLHWQLLTKRADRIAENLPADWVRGPGSTGDNRRARSLSLPRCSRPARHWDSRCPIADVLDLTGIEWLIFGGESGPGFRPMDVQWARDIRVKCRESGTAFFFKQSAAYRTEMGIELDGQIVRAFPEKIQMINGIPA